MAATDIIDLDALRTTCGIADHESDLWLAGAVAAVSEAVEAVTGRWYASRSTTLYFDGSPDAYELPVAVGVASLTYLGTATSDQPDGGTGTYTEIPTGSRWLDPPLQDRRTGAPASRITLSGSGGYAFPASGVRRSIKATGVFGSTSARVSQIATAAVIRAFRARQSGGADYAIVGPDGGMKILRDFAPSELEELRNVHGEPLVA